MEDEDKIDIPKTVLLGVAAAISFVEPVPEMMLRTEAFFNRDNHAMAQDLEETADFLADLKKGAEAVAQVYAERDSAPEDEIRDAEVAVDIGDQPPLPETVEELARMYAERDSSGVK